MGHSARLLSPALGEPQRVENEAKGIFRDGNSTGMAQNTEKKIIQALYISIFSGIKQILKLGPILISFVSTKDLVASLYG